jgi:hypothetical protein
MRYQIHWTNKASGATGIGRKLFDESEAAAICQELNSEYPHMAHTVQPEGTPKESLTSPPPGLPTPAVLSPVLLAGDDPCPVRGDHYGKQMDQLPAHFLDWLDGQAWLPRIYPGVADYIKRNRTAINQDLVHAEHE